MRPKQWFKSLSILFGASVVLYLEGITTSKIINIILILIGLSLLSSAIYVLNDIADKEKDKLHPIKKNRPIASGKISTKQGIIIAIILLLTSSIIFYSIMPGLLTIAGLMIINNLLYSYKPFRLKDIPVFDVISAGLNFSLRVLIGWYALTSTEIYKTLILWPFFISGFLLSCKRLAEYNYLKDKKVKIRKVFQYYNENTLKLSINVYLTLSILTYYFFSNIFNKNLFLIGPWFFIQMYWYKSFLKEKSSVVKKPEDVFMKKKLFTLSGLGFCTTWILILLFS